MAISNTQIVNPWGRRYLTLLYTAVVNTISSRGSAMFLIATAKRLLAGIEAESASEDGRAAASAAQATAIFPDKDLNDAIDVRIRADIMASAGLMGTLGALGGVLAVAFSVTVGTGVGVGLGGGGIISFFSWIADKIEADKRR